MARRRTDWRRVADELDWVIQQINVRDHDQNPDRSAQLRVLKDYGIRLSIAARSGWRLPERPEPDEAI